MSFGSKSSSTTPKTGTDGLPLPTITSATPTTGDPIPRTSVAVQDKLSDDTKQATLLAPSQDDENQLLKKGLG